jgi:hypothetical protein
VVHRAVLQVLVSGVTVPMGFWVCNGLLYLDSSLHYCKYKSSLFCIFNTLF